MIRKIPFRCFIVQAHEQAARGERAHHFQAGALSPERGFSEFCRDIRLCRFLRHHVNDTADEGPAKTSRDISAVNFDAFYIFDRNGGDIDSCITAEVRHDTIDKDADLCCGRTTNIDDGILSLAIHFTHMHARDHFQ